MATISCPNCAREISDDATTCPYCGTNLEGMGVEGPPPERPDPPEHTDEAGDFRVGGPDPLAESPSPRAEAAEDVLPDRDARAARDEEAVAREADPVAPAGDEAGEGEDAPHEASARPASAGIQWNAVLAGFLTFLLAGFVLSFFLAPGVASVVTIALGVGVSYGMARDRKILHAGIAFLAYYVLSVLLGLLLGIVGPTGPGGPPPAAP